MGNARFEVGQLVTHRGSPKPLAEVIAVRDAPDWIDEDDPDEVIQCVTIRYEWQGETRERRIASWRLRHAEPPQSELAYGGQCAP